MRPQLHLLMANVVRAQIEPTPATVFPDFFHSVTSVGPRYTGMSNRRSSMQSLDATVVTTRSERRRYLLQ